MGGADGMRKGYHDLLRRENLELILLTAKSLLDLGCGAGNLGKALKLKQSCLVHGIELSRDAVKIAEKNLDRVWCDNLNRFDPLFLKQKYDTLIFADILEHLINPWDVLKKFCRVLADNGSVIVSLPNVAHPWIIKNLQKDLFRYEPAGILDITHLRFFTQTSIFQMFYSAGLKITNFRPYPSKENPIQYHITATRAISKHKDPQTTILILTHNGWEYTNQCLESIKKNTSSSHKILVVDNGSTDGTIEHLRKDKTLYHIENYHNLGFAAGFNTGLMLVDTPYFVLCNSDVIVTRNWLSRLRHNIDSDKNLLILGPRSNYVSGPQQINNVPYTTSCALEAFAQIQYDTTAIPISYFPRIVFFCVLLKSIALKTVGFLDEIFGMGNYEDDDYCLRSLKAGYKNAFDNSVFVHHHGSVSFKKKPEEYRALLEGNKKKFMAKWNLTNYGGPNG